jgi:hypothetical protein
MRTIDDVYFDLLKKFDSFCRSHHLKYYIDVKNALSIYRYNQAAYQLNNCILFMHVQDFKEMIHLMKEHPSEDTYFEYISTNEHYYSFYARFGDLHSIDYEANAMGLLQHYGICLSIKPLVPLYLNDDMNAAIRHLENVWQNAIDEIKPSEEIEEKIYLKMIRFRQRQKYRRLQKWFLRKLLKSYTQKAEFKVYRGGKKLKKKYFKEPSLLSYRESSFMTMSHIEDVFVAQFGHDWRNYHYFSSVNKFKIVYPDVSYKDVLTSDDTLFMRQEHKQRLDAYKRRSIYQKKIDKYTSLFMRSFERIQMSKYLKVHYHLINEQDFLNTFMCQYDQTTKKYLKNKQSFFINHDIQQYYYDYLKKQNRDKEIINIQSLLDSDPLSSIECIHDPYQKG